MNNKRDMGQMKNRLSENRKRSKFSATKNKNKKDKNSQFIKKSNRKNSKKTLVKTKKSKTGKRRPSARDAYDNGVQLGTIVTYNGIKWKLTMVGKANKKYPRWQKLKNN
jgi:hypothetical protein